jgi:cytochrome b561
MSVQAVYGFLTNVLQNPRVNHYIETMSTNNTPTPYDTVSRAFHWITAIVVVITFALGPEHFGRLMHEGLDPATRIDIVWHETLGMLIFALTACRLLWVAFRPSAPQTEMPGWMNKTSKAVHLALWALLLALPATALLALGSEDHPLTLLGGLRVDHMPAIAQLAIAEMADWGDVHQFLGDAIIWLAGLHAVAALYHHFVLKDGVLAKMLPVKWLR